ncbi:hypothetical protein RhiirA5_373404 [Rhizophagus irregularis]|uniref:Uncharacterized protein n=2 Tax=Rhizophagus irregularis TaxID=588596 RepID=A0A2N0PYY4_9GLOM|nr:hypothetical protein GLOIN_2v1834649 [Rhizophagus irregularis DAOM 181602=DAOM 197198]PKC12047.1 hypothetical protein RhiirA5_373404 [Rhizophagus irregularis]POG81994.1 hypothetical protein GLOIN_2v1834649 [Rhizophagus irregularis DAOM 181602=DAOM 197198]|eukprot:XP_025188860.1 hypothetical protein GLOIN_2v1834649 [Rhizophagus irregularis DAOM 181602=DAOM 197198]
MLDFFIFLTEGGIILWVTVSSRPFDKTKKFKETAEESKKCFVYVMERKDVVDEDRLELYKNDLTNLMFHQNDHVYEWKLQGGQKLITVLNKKTSEKIKEFLGKDKKNR